MSRQLRAVEFEKKEKEIMNFDNYNDDFAFDNYKDDFASNEGLILTVTDLDQYVGTIRNFVILAYLEKHKKSETDTRAVRYVKELIETTDPEELLSHSQCVDLVLEQTVATEEGHILFTESSFIDILQEVQTAIFGRALTKAAADGYLECSWDDSKNDMVFWE